MKTTKSASMRQRNKFLGSPMLKHPQLIYILYLDPFHCLGSGLVACEVVFYYRPGPVV